MSEVDYQDIARGDYDPDGCWELSFVELKHQTDAAVLVDTGTDDLWIPKSVIALADPQTLWVAEWFARKEGWI